METEITDEIEILAEDHWNWLAKILKEAIPPKDWEMFERLCKIIYLTAFKHGAKHKGELSA